LPPLLLKPGCGSISITENGRRYRYTNDSEERGYEDSFSSLERDLPK
jgi:hypothetical protein